MYEFILWTCLLSSPNCPVYNSVRHFVMVYPAKSKEMCEAMWQESLTQPDPDGTKSYHKCEAVGEDL